MLPSLEAGIDLLIGYDIADAYTPLEVRTGPKGTQHATRSRLGWIPWNIAKTDIDHVNVNFIESKAQEIRNLETLMENAINMDFPERAVDDKREHSRDDALFLEKVDRSIKLVDNHYQIDLPFREPIVRFPNNLEQAENRLHSLKSRMGKNSQFREDYKSFMFKILDKGYAEKVPENRKARDDGKVWYIPHHGVYHPRKKDKIRVVFDCASRYNGVSLNQSLLSGPNLTSSLIGVLTRFREKSIAIMADVETMFYQISVPEKDRDCLRFLWWPDGNTELEPVMYHMTVHLFGAASSPSCANAALRRTAIDNQHLFSRDVTSTLLKHFYVDDCLRSVDLEVDAISMVSDLVSLCAKGGFNLTKWLSNSKQVLSSISVDQQAKEVKDLDLENSGLPVSHTLGLIWSADSDMFQIRTEIRDQLTNRRGLLSVVASVYDPLGFVAPFVLSAKIMLQDLCKRKLSWDESLDEKDRKQWQQWLTQLPQLSQVEIPRCMVPTCMTKPESVQIHGFCDASNLAYGCVWYLRYEDIQGLVHCSLLFSRSRVAPLKKITIPRLELTAATMVVRISNVLSRELNLTIDKFVFWTDSTSVLKYIANESTRFHTFVANRVSVIREVTNVDQWRYVESEKNPADYASRGLSVNKMLECKDWFDGPDFIWKSESEWPSATKVDNALSSGDVEVIAAVSDVKVKPVTFLNRFSNWNRLKRVVAWLFLFIRNTQKRVLKKKEH